MEAAHLFSPVLSGVNVSECLRYSRGREGGGVAAATFFTSCDPVSVFASFEPEQPIACACRDEECWFLVFEWIVREF